MKKVEELENRIKELENRIKALENHNINNIIKRVERLDNKIDDLEAKNYQLKADMDRIINNINLNDKGGVDVK